MIQYLKILLATSLVAFLSLLTVVISTQPVNALDPNEKICSPDISNGPEKPIFCTDKSTSNPIFGPSGIITKITQVIIYAAGFISVVVIVVGGLRYVLSGGDANSTKGAKDSIMYAVIGLAVALFAQAIVAFVLKKL